jgi:hypothetical protein
MQIESEASPTVTVNRVVRVMVLVVVLVSLVVSGSACATDIWSV